MALSHVASAVVVGVWMLRTSVEVMPAVTCVETLRCPSRRIFYQCLLGVQYLHSQLVVHLDLKPDNILLVR
jgi:hypothetical protein